MEYGTKEGLIILLLLIGIIIAIVYDILTDKHLPDTHPLEERHHEHIPA